MPSVACPSPVWPPRWLQTVWRAIRGVDRHDSPSLGTALHHLVPLDYAPLSGPNAFRAHLRTELGKEAAAECAPTKAQAAELCAALGASRRGWRGWAEEAGAHECEPEPSGIAADSVDGSAPASASTSASASPKPNKRSKKRRGVEAEGNPGQAAAIAALVLRYTETHHGAVDEVIRHTRTRRPHEEATASAWSSARKHATIWLRTHMPTWCHASLGDPLFPRG